MFDVPDLKVEIAFDSDAFDTTPTWTDVSEWVLDSPGTSIRRGRPNELATFMSGQCNLVLDNDDARFSPLNASSPYVGKLLPRKQIRVTATWAATDYVLFRGFITSGFPQGYDEGGLHSVVALDCYDAFAILNETKLADMYYGYMKTGIGSLACTYRGLVNRRLVDQVTGDTTIIGSSAVTGAADLVPGLSGSDAVVFNGNFYASNANITSAGTSASYSFWIQTSSAAASTTRIVVGAGTGFPSGMVGGIGVDTAGKIYGSLDEAGTSIVSSLSSVNDGQIHHVVAVFNGAIANAVYIDGQVDTSTNTPVAVSHGVVSIGGLNALGTTYENFIGTIQDVAMFTKALSATEVRNLYRIGMGYADDTTATRIGYVLDAAGWPSSWRTITTQPYGRCAETYASGSSALAQMQLVAATEQGAMFVASDGNITLKSRYTHDFAGSAAKVVQAIISDDGADTPYEQAGFDYDDLLVQNQITVTSEAGSAFYLDQTSIDRYGSQDASITTQLGSYQELRTMAEGLIYWRKDPQIRTRPVTVLPQLNTTDWPTMLGLELGHRVEFQITPPGMAAQYAVEQLLQTMDWDITQSRWELTVQGSPIPASFGVYDSGDDFDGTGIKFGF